MAISALNSYAKQNKTLYTNLLVIGCTLLFINASAQRPGLFKITGKLHSDTATGYVYLYYPANEKWKKDSSRVMKGTFSFAGEVMHPVLARMMYKNQVKQIFLEPSTIQTITKGDQFARTKIVGSRTHNTYERLDSSIEKINTRWQIVMDTLSEVNKRSNTAFQGLKDWVLKPYFEEITEAYLSFFRQYPTSFVTAYFLSINVIEMNQGNMPGETLRAYYNKFSPNIKNSTYGRKIIEELEKRKIAVAGTRAIDFTKPDLQQQPLSLSSFKDKYILLDFWGSWCVPCRKGNPHLKELYSRYNKLGFEIIGIAADNNTQDAWRKAIEKDGLPWHHILIDDLEAIYNITSYPTKILIDKQGVIIGRYGAGEEELDRQLKSIFNM